MTPSRNFFSSDQNRSGAKTWIIVTWLGVLVLLVSLLAYSGTQEARRLRTDASTDALKQSREVAVSIDGLLSSSKYMLVTLSVQPDR